jgi:hypothetical protein
VRVGDIHPPFYAESPESDPRFIDEYIVSKLYPMSRSSLKERKRGLFKEEIWAKKAF